MLLYITRKFPPSIGGMQRFNYKLSCYLRKTKDFHIISWGGSQLFLPLFLITAFLKTFYYCIFKNVNCIYISDGLLSPFGLVLKKMFCLPVVGTVHGRDIAFNNKIYQKLVPWSLKRLDKILCVSSKLEKECIKRKIPEHLIEVIPNGIDIEDFECKVTPAHISHFESLAQTSFEKKRILITVGRLVPKKGIHSFLTNILPLVLKKNPGVIYLIVGDGPLEAEIRRIINDRQLGEHAFLVGKVNMDSHLLPVVYKMADIFVMPNIPVDNDLEGFGIVALESCASGKPVIASKVDGIPDAIKDGENGILIQHADYSCFSDKILELLENHGAYREISQKCKQYVAEHYSWEKIASQYWNIFNALVEQKNRH